MKIRNVSKFIAAGLVMLAVGESSSFAGPGFVGINYGPYHKPGQTPERPDDPPITDAQYREDLSKIVDKFGYIRTYGTEKRVLGLVPFIAQNYPHLNVYLGIWESSKYRAATEEQMTKAIELAKKYPNIVEYIIVGNECLDQDFADGAVSVEQLIADINKVKQNVPSQVKVTTCFGFHSGLNPEKLEDGSPNPYYRPGKDYGKRVMQQSQADSLMFTVYPFYAGLDVSKARITPNIGMTTRSNMSPMENRSFSVKLAGPAPGSRTKVRPSPACRMSRNTPQI